MTDSERALSGDLNLQHAKLQGANLQDANLQGANLQYANLQCANLQYANLQYAKLQGASLHDANLQGASLQGADLQGASLQGASLQDAKLQCANLQYANLQGAKLQGANLQGANLHDANLSSCIGLTTAKEWLINHFYFVDDGVVVYKTFYEHYAPPDMWVIKEGSLINEVVNKTATQECGCGVNFATLEWLRSNTQGTVWACVLHWEDLADTVIPYNTDGKARCAQLELIHKL